MASDFDKLLEYKPPARAQKKRLDLKPKRKRHPILNIRKKLKI